MAQTEMAMCGDVDVSVSTPDDGPGFLLKLCDAQYDRVEFGMHKHDVETLLRRLRKAYIYRHGELTWREFLDSRGWKQPPA